MPLQSTIYHFKIYEKNCYKTRNTIFFLNKIFNICHYNTIKYIRQSMDQSQLPRLSLQINRPPQYGCLFITQDNVPMKDIADKSSCCNMSYIWYTEYTTPPNDINSIQHITGIYFRPSKTISTFSLSYFGQKYPMYDPVPENFINHEWNIQYLL